MLMTSDLLDILQYLKRGSVAIRQAGQTALRVPELTSLRKVIDLLGDARPARPLMCPDEYRRAWQSVRDKGVGGTLSDRAVRYLAWEPDVALDPKFHFYLDENNLQLGARGIQGFVRACHHAWPRFLKDTTIQSIALRHLRSYVGANRIISRWKSEKEIVSAAGPNTLAKAMLAGLLEPHAMAAHWGIDEGSPFFVEMVRAVVDKARSHWRESEDIRAYVFRHLLPWSKWPIAVLKEVCAECILHPGAMLPEVNERVKSFVTRYPQLGDPRLPEKRTNWLGVRIEAKQRLIEWLSRADIQFFFDHAFPKGGDKHRRKPFWLRYVSRVVMSRPLLSFEDAARLQEHQRRHGGEIGNFGKMNGMNSAFLLDFGNVCAIEFNHVGACYVYDRKATDQVVEDFWARGYFTESKLKKPDLCIERIIHNPGWEWKMEQVLARFGVRPS